MSFPTPFSIGHTSSQKGQSPAQRDSENAVTSEKLTKQPSTMIFFQILARKSEFFSWRIFATTEIKGLSKP